MNDITSIFKQDEYTRPELARLLRISYQTRPETIFSRIKREKIGRKHIYKKEDIVKYLESCN